MSALRPDDLASDDVHGWRADEFRNEEIGRVLIKFERRTDLLHAPGIQNDDAVGERHRLHLIVSDVNHRRLGHLLVELGDFDAGGDTQRRIEVGQWLVEQEDLRVAADRAADGNTLALAAQRALGRRSRYCVSCRISAAARTRRSISCLFSLAIFMPKAMLS